MSESLWSYVHDHDPQPRRDGDELVLDGCKRQIREGAKKGDWVTGVAGKNFDAPYKYMTWAGEIDQNEGGVLRFRRFVYFGSDAIKMPDDLTPVTSVPRNFRRPLNDPFVEQFKAWIDTLLANAEAKPSVQGLPSEARRRKPCVSKAKPSCSSATNTSKQKGTKTC